MNGYNKVILMGTAGADAEVKTLENGNAVASMSIAINETYLDKSNVRQTNTQWFRIEAWNGLANFLGQYGKKGTPFLIEGKLKTESYEKDGVTTYFTKIIANNINFAGNKSNTQAAQPQAAQPQAAQPQAAQPQAAQPQAAQPQAAQPQYNTQQPQYQNAPVQQAQQQVSQYTTSDEFMNGMGNSDDLPF